MLSTQSISGSSITRVPPNACDDKLQVKEKLSSYHTLPLTNQILSQAMFSYMRCRVVQRCMWTLTPPAGIADALSSDVVAAQSVRGTVASQGTVEPVSARGTAALATIARVAGAAHAFTWYTRKIQKACVILKIS